MPACTQARGHLNTLELEHDANAIRALVEVCGNERRILGIVGRESPPKFGYSTAITRGFYDLRYTGKTVPKDFRDHDDFVVLHSTTNKRAGKGHECSLRINGRRLAGYI